MLDNKRIEWMDVARTFAILSVLLCHSVESVYSMRIEEWNLLNNVNKLFSINAHTIGRLGVPIFVFLSGALLFNKNIDNDEQVKNFYKHNLFPLFIAVECWNVIYDLFIYIFKIEEINFTTVINNLLFFQQVKMSHMWYMPMILGMYLSIPFISNIIKKFSSKVFCVPMIIVIITSFIIPNINIVLKIFNKPINNIILDLSFCGGVYGTYLMIGYYINKNILKNISLFNITISVAIFYIITVIFQIYVNNKGFNYHVWYDFFGLLITTALIFEIFHRLHMKNKKIINITRCISSLSLGIFFVHRPIQLLICKYINLNQLPLSVSVVIIWASTIVISVMIVCILKRISYIAKWLFIIK